MGRPNRVKLRARYPAVNYLVCPVVYSYRYPHSVRFRVRYYRNDKNFNIFEARMILCAVVGKYFISFQVLVLEIGASEIQL